MSDANAVGHGSAEPGAGRLRDLQRRLDALEAHAATLQRRNERLTTALNAAREHILALKTHEVDEREVSGTYATACSGVDRGMLDVVSGGRKHRVHVDPELAARGAVRLGTEVLLDENMVAVAAFPAEQVGDVVALREVLEDGRAVIVLPSGEERLARVAAGAGALRGGDLVLFDGRGSMVLERLESAQVTDVVLEEVPDISYSDIGGLDRQIEQIEDAIELPFVQPELFAEHRLRPPKGVLLYGPPGCGKTLIAKAVAASLTRKAAEKAGLTGQRSYFLNVKGPELLNKYVGETERQIRHIFARAREKATEGLPVVVFFDEMDSLFRTRGSGVSSDMETTVVPQLLAEIDGVEGLRNVIVIGASNREDMIDPAILRPGRLDVKIRIERPDERGARDIFAKYLTADLPVHGRELARFGSPEAAVAGLIDETVERIYADVPGNRFLEVTYADGSTEQLAFKDFTSGAMIRNIVDRAKKHAIKDLLATGERGISAAHLERSVREEFAQNEDLPSTTNPDDWARVSGRRGQRIVSMRALAQAGLADLG